MAGLPFSSSNVAHVRPMMKPPSEVPTRKMYQSIKLNVNGVLKNVLVPIDAVHSTAQAPTVSVASATSVVTSASLRSLLVPQPSRPLPAILQRSKPQTTISEMQLGDGTKALSVLQSQNEQTNSQQQKTVILVPPPSQSQNLSGGISSVFPSHLSTVRSMYSQAVQKSTKPVSTELKIGSVFSLAQQQHDHGISEVSPIVIAPDDDEDQPVVTSVAQQGLQDLFEECEIMERSAAAEKARESRLSSDTDNDPEEQEFLSKIGMLESPPSPPTLPAPPPPPASSTMVPVVPVSTSVPTVVPTQQSQPVIDLDPDESPIAEQPEEGPQLMNYCHVVLEKYKLSSEQATFNTRSLDTLWKECDKCPLVLCRQRLRKRHLAAKDTVEEPAQKTRVTMEMPPKLNVTVPQQKQQTVKQIMVSRIVDKKKEKTSTAASATETMATSSQSKRFLMVKTNAGSFLVPMENEDCSQVVNLPVNSSGVITLPNPVPQMTSTAKLPPPNVTTSSSYPSVSTPSSTSFMKVIHKNPVVNTTDPLASTRSGFSVIKEQIILTHKQPEEVPKETKINSSLHGDVTSQALATIKATIQPLKATHCSTSQPASLKTIRGVIPRPTVPKESSPRPTVPKESSPRPIAPKESSQDSSGTPPAPAKKETASERIKRLKEQLKKDQIELEKIRKSMTLKHNDNTDSDDE
ncbi:hypothetical protein CAPTEDRAFT_221062 [Capitella teleta]|uniref:Uncharacterized protein n=1 Tax=Capitella teleta TaxID=283909 RepID=R7UAD3_CAPTE|nr:hypothetical protein CAPTEDRAFT_221062 [Capitella teleta]|eukprot:ELU03081.1 hypothetical protein CAPTEDRAFT_221062 [Capitella teleta]